MKTNFYNVSMWCLTHYLPRHNFAQQKMDSGNWIVDEIPGLHRTYANLDDEGYWVYWEPTDDGRWRWNPKWVVYDHTIFRNILTELELELSKLVKEEAETPEKDKTNEWYQSIAGRKLSLDTEISYYHHKLAINTV